MRAVGYQPINTCDVRPNPQSASGLGLSSRSYDDEHNQMKNLILLQELMLLSMCRNRLSNKIDRFLP